MTALAQRIGTRAEFEELFELLWGAARQVMRPLGKPVTLLGWLLSGLAVVLSLLVGGKVDPASLTGDGTKFGIWLGGLTMQVFGVWIGELLDKLIVPAAGALDWLMSLNLGALAAQATDALVALLTGLGNGLDMLETWLLSLVGINDVHWAKNVIADLTYGIDGLEKMGAAFTPPPWIIEILNAVPGALALVPLGVWLGKAKAPKDT